jgi:hypothetical protein
MLYLSGLEILVDFENLKMEAFWKIFWKKEVC